MKHIYINKNDIVFVCHELNRDWVNEFTNFFHCYVWPGLRHVRMKKVLKISEIFEKREKTYEILYGRFRGVFNSLLED